LDAPGPHVTTLGDVAEMLKNVRNDSRLSQDELATRAGVARTTVTRMETVAGGVMSDSPLLRNLRREVQIDCGSSAQAALMRFRFTAA